jgi:predicted permease
MRSLRKLRLRVRSLFRSDSVERELSDELRFHVERQIADYQAAGMSTGEARSAALRELGGAEQIKEECRDARTVKFLYDFVQDARFGARMLRKGPGFAAVAIVTLALGICACATLLSITYDGFFAHGEFDGEWYAIISSMPERHVFYYRFSAPEFREILDATSGLAELGAVTGFSAALNRGEYPEQVHGTYISANVLPMLRTAPIMGRAFTPDDDKRGAPTVAMVDYEMWQSKFAGDPNIVGRVIELDQRKYPVIGVLPAHFRLWGGGVYLPMQLDMASTDRTNRGFWITGVLRKGVSVRQLSAALERVKNQWQREYGGQYPEYAGMQFMVKNVMEWVHAAIRPAIEVLIAATGLVLLVATVNLANLLLAKAASRRRESAVRAALGASRGRIARQVLTETALMSVAGAALGILLAIWAVPLAGSLIPYDLLTPANGAYRLEPFAVVISLVVAVLMGICFGVAPALGLSRASFSNGLKESSTRTMGDRVGRRSRNILIITETAVTIVLMAGAALVVQTYRNLMRADLGFKPERVLSMEMSLPYAKFRTSPEVAAFYNDVLSRLAVLPGADGAAATSGRPMVDRTVDLARQDFTIDGIPPPNAGAIPNAAVNVVSTQYFDVMGMRFLGGHGFRDSDADGAPLVAVVNESLVRAYFHGEPPVGRQIRLGELNPAPLQPGYANIGATVTIVGEVADAKQLRIIDAPIQPQFFVPLAQRPQQARHAAIFVRGKVDAARLESGIRHAVAAIDRAQPVFDVMPMDKVVADAYGPKRITTALLGIFAGLALALVVIGFYAVIAYGVAQRTREIGVRMALGASPRGILEMVLREGAKLVAWGVAAGIVCALLLTQFLQEMLFGVSSADPVALASVSALLFIVAIGACWIPARRAMRTDPIIAIRCD